MARKEAVDTAYYWIGATVTLLFSVGMLSREFKKPEELWVAHAEPLQWGLLGAGLVSQVLMLYRSWRLKRDRVVRRQDDDFRDVSRLLVVQILDMSPDVKATSLGVHVWIARGRWAKCRRLCRRTSFNLHKVPPSGIKWTAGKGVIGTCFRSGVEQSKDLRSIAAVARDGGEADFMALPGSERLGLTYEEFSKVKRYAFVHAWPLKDEEGEVLGCVSVDYTDSATVDALAAAIQQPMLTSFVTIINEAVRNREG